ncbi:Rrf2 family transcriptional regulator [Sinorhizobium fredii]|uniref:Rrf2 family transcriptional regulator n=1 Tax=Rhizobium fredii TaxID=380 RepID=UPI001F3F9C8E|nr:Rrf2 family transcriptional regulator [Sinorhizobium fredii]
MRNKIPKKFLDTILLELRNVLCVRRRVHMAGIRLSKPASEIMIGQVIRALDGPLAPIHCASRSAFEACDDCNDPVYRQSVLVICHRGKKLGYGVAAWLRNASRVEPSDVSRRIIAQHQLRISQRPRVTVRLRVGITGMKSKWVARFVSESLSDWTGTRSHS